MACYIVGDIVVHAPPCSHEVRFVQLDALEKGLLAR